MNVERGSRRERPEVAEEARAPGALIIGVDRLRRRPLAEREPRGARANAVQIRVDRPLQPIARVWGQIANPRVEVDDAIVVLRLAELHMAETVAAKNDL